MSDSIIDISISITISINSISNCSMNVIISIICITDRLAYCNDNY